MRVPSPCALLLVIASATAHAQQRDTLPERDTLAILGLQPRLELGVVFGYEVLPASMMSGETDVDAGAIVRAALDYRFRHGLATFGMLGGSIARVTSTLADDAGTTTHMDVMAGLSWRPPIRQREPEPVSLHVAGGATIISGPDDIPPYRLYSDRSPQFMWEVGLSVHPGGRFGGMLGYQTVEVPPQVEVDEQPIHRIILVVRIAR